MATRTYRSGAELCGVPVPGGEVANSLLEFGRHFVLSLGFGRDVPSLIDLHYKVVIWLLFP